MSLNHETSTIADMAASMNPPPRVFLTSICRVSAHFSKL